MDAQDDEVWVISELIYDALSNAGIKCDPPWDSQEWRVATISFLRECRAENVRIPLRYETAPVLPDLTHGGEPFQHRTNSAARSSRHHAGGT